MNAFINTPVIVEDGAAVVFQGLNFASRGCWANNGGWLFAPQVTGQFTLTKPGTYRIAFTGVVTGFAGNVQLEMDLNGAAIPGTDMQTTLAAATGFTQVAATAEVVVPAGGNGYVTIRNITGDAVTIDNASLVITRIS